MLKSVQIENLTRFRHFDSGNFAPINLFLGANDTGKTGLLKLLYASTKTLLNYSLDQYSLEKSYLKLLGPKIYDVFQPYRHGLGELVARNENARLSVELELEHGVLGYQDRLVYSFGESTKLHITEGSKHPKRLPDSFRCLFIPSKEVLTTLKAIRATRDNLNIIGFDDTYLDLIRALVLPTQKGNFTRELKQVNEDMLNLFGGSIEQGPDDDFFYKKGNTVYSMQLTAEGIKKIGILSTLIRNRQLNATSVLFIDEPETALHPKAIRSLVAMLIKMAKAGVQLFLSTHNPFVINQMHLTCRKENIVANCYALRQVHDHTESICYPLHETYPDNDIAEEAIKLADEEMDLRFSRL